MFELLRLDRFRFPDHGAFSRSAPFVAASPGSTSTFAIHASISPIRLSTSVFSMARSGETK
jgi:hypothetical protein